MTDQSTSGRKRPVMLCILDGWGHNDSTTDNAIALGRTPHWDHLVESRPLSYLGTSGTDVGLPAGQMGNSEVGHMTIGSGRVILQDLPRISHAFDANLVDSVNEFVDLVNKLQASNGVCHIAGLLSPGGVHSHQDHIIALARLLSDAGIPVRVHAFLDGRDTPPTSGRAFVEEVAAAIAGLENTEIATLTGRYFAMDRDTNWDRVAVAYKALFDGTGTAFTDPAAAVAAAYERGETDEFITPLVAESYAGIQDGDGFIMANFRADRARELLIAITDPDFTAFDRGRRPALADIKGMVEYSADLAKTVPAFFPPIEVENTLGDVVSARGLTQLRIAETEKYAHVTFFLNGGEETVFDGEERILVPSPKVATYDLKPEMSAPEVEEKLTEAIKSGRFDLIVVNFANPDMVGHTGVLPAAIQAVETIDGCVGRLTEVVNDAGGYMLVTADHGNIELMKDPKSGKPHTAHTTNLVPLVLTAGEGIARLENGTLADLAPTVLHLMGVETPADMTGRNLAIAEEDVVNDRVAS